MALAVQTQVSDGSLTKIQVGIDFIEQADIQVYFDLAASPLVAGSDYTWTASKTITFSSAVPAGTTAFLLRQTNVEEVLNVFDGGASFSRYTLDENFHQILLLAQEVREGVGLRGIFLPLDMHGYQIKNLGNPTADTDAVNLAAVKALCAQVTAGYQAGDANLQAQLTGNVPLLASAFSPISWHGQTIENSVSIPANKNAWSFGPQMRIAEGQRVQIGEGSTWTIAEGDEQEGSIDLSQYLKAVPTYADLRSSSLLGTRVAVTAPGVAGLFVADPSDSTSTDNGGTVIVSNSGVRWKRRYSGPADVRWFGATAGSGDSTAALQRALSSGLPLYVSGRYYCTQQLTSTSTFCIIGDGRGSSSIYWTSAATSVGLYLTPASFANLYLIRGIDLLTEATVAGASLLYASWASLSTSTLGADNMFSPKLLVQECEIKTVGQSATLAYPVVLDYVWSYEFNRVFVYGAYIPNASRNAEANFVSKVGIDVRNSKATSVAAQGTTGGRYNDVSIQMCGLAAQVWQVEGLWINNCDFQANFRGALITRNNLDRTNQIRVTNTHFGNPGRGLHIYQHNYVHISGCEFSYGGLNADTATEVPLLYLENSSFATVVNNTFRGNSVGTARTLPITGVKVYGSANNAASGFAVFGTIAGNVFEHMSTGVSATGFASSTHVDPSNRFSDITTKVSRDSTAGWPALIYGNAALDGTAPSTGYPQGYFSNSGGIAFGANRVGGGNVMGFYADGTLGGYINVTTTTATLTNTSDQTLKEYVSEVDLDEQAARIDAIKLKNYRWLSTQEEDMGVFAQELHKVFPEAVFPGGWQDEQGNPVAEYAEGAVYMPWAISYTKLIPAMIAALQRLNKKVGE